MPAIDDAELDARVKALHARGAHQEAAVAILEALGHDVLRVIHGRLRDSEQSAEVFSRFSEVFWRALPGFSFRCSVRAWVFTLARNTTYRYLDRDVRPERQAVPLDELPSFAAQLARTVTLLHQQTENRDRVAELRSELPAADQLLLTLRIHQGLPFRDVARVMLGDADADDAALEREAARLRKRLQAVTELLRDKLRAERER